MLTIQLLNIQTAAFTWLHYFLVHFTAHLFEGANVQVTEIHLVMVLAVINHAFFVYSCLSSLKSLECRTRTGSKFCHCGPLNQQQVYLLSILIRHAFQKGWVSLLEHFCLLIHMQNHVGEWSSSCEALSGIYLYAGFFSEIT